MEHRTITRDALKARIDNGDKFHLVMVLGEMAFRAKHIPGSENYSTEEQIRAHLERNDDIVVYCSSEACGASQLAYARMVEDGYTSVVRYAGGVLEWETAGYPLEGELSKS